MLKDKYIPLAVALNYNPKSAFFHDYVFHDYVEILLATIRFIKYHATIKFWTIVSQTASLFDLKKMHVSMVVYPYNQTI